MKQDVCVTLQPKIELDQQDSDILVWYDFKVTPTYRSLTQELHAFSMILQDYIYLTT